MSDGISVFLCTGCEIGGALDLEGLGTVASEDSATAEIYTHPSLCSEEGVSAIRDAIGEIMTTVGLELEADGEAQAAESLSLETPAQAALNSRVMLSSR